MDLINSGDRGDFHDTKKANKRVPGFRGILLLVIFVQARV